jgi:phosphoethanolamine N-methyltransferase
MTDPQTDAQKFFAVVEAIWGEGFLSPGGRDEVARMIGDHDLRGRSVLDIGCGLGGADLALVQAHGAAHVTGIDVEDPALDRARRLVAAHGLDARIGLMKVAPGPLPFPAESFDVVFSKDSIVLIPDKQALMAEVFRVLKPGGLFIGSDWLLGSETVSPLMAEYLTFAELDSGMATPARYRAAMEQAGFAEIRMTSRNAWYRDQARVELARLRGEAGTRAAAIAGRAHVDYCIQTWARMIPVLDSGEHCPTHLSALKPR